MGKRPTITDVARLCDVTPATVSRVLNGKKDFSARQEVRERIVNTAREIGYMPDLAARNLNRKHTRIVGIFASPDTNLAEGISESLLEGLVDVLQPAKYEVFFELAAGNVDRAQPLPFWRFDGAVLLQAPRPETVEALRQRHVPFVAVNEQAEGASAVVISSDTEGVELALDHLKKLGHTQIAYANAGEGYLPHYSIPERHDALVAGSKKRRMKLADGHDTAFTDADIFLQQAIDNGVTAVLTYDHQLAVRVLGAAYQMKMRIPEDLSLMCFNDLFPVAILPPPLTAIRVAGRAMGETGANLLLEALASGKPSTKTNVVRLPEELVVRSSTAAPRKN